MQSAALSSSLLLLLLLLLPLRLLLSCSKIWHFRTQDQALLYNMPVSSVHRCLCAKFTSAHSCCLKRGAFVHLTAAHFRCVLVLLYGYECEFCVYSWMLSKCLFVQVRS